MRSKTVPPARQIDTGRAVEIEASPVKMLGLAAAGLVMTLLSAMIALHVVPKVRPGSLQEFLGYVGLALFGWATLIIVWRAFTTRGPVVIITREGIRDSRIAAEFIPWSAIKDISIYKYHKQRFMVLAVDPAVEAGLSVTLSGRWMRLGYHSLGPDGLCISAQELKISFDELVATSLAYARASTASAGSARASSIDAEI
jgi:hypothetical protein